MIQCDETKPQCQRCSRTRRPCPGYRVQSEVMFRNMNSIAEEKVKARVKSRIQAEEPNQELEDDALQRIDVSFMPSALGWLRDSQVALSNVPRSVSIKWQDVAVPRFFEDYIYLSDAVPRGSLNFLPDLCSSSSTSSVLRGALDALALRNLANQLGQENLEVDARKSYCRSIPLLAQLLQDEEEAKKDSTLCAILLFGIYEVSSARNLSSLYPTRTFVDSLWTLTIHVRLLVAGGRENLGSLATKMASYICCVFGARVNSTTAFKGTCSVSAILKLLVFE